MKHDGEIQFVSPKIKKSFGQNILSYLKKD